MPMKDILNLDQNKQDNQITNEEYSKNDIFDFISFCDSLGSENPYSFKTFLKKKEGEKSEHGKAPDILESHFLGEDNKINITKQAHDKLSLPSPIIITELPDVGNSDMEPLNVPQKQENSEVQTIRLLKPPVIQSECCFSNDFLQNSLQGLRKINFDEQLRKDNILSQLKQENIQLNHLLQNSNKSLKLAQENHLLRVKLRELSNSFHEKCKRIEYLEKELQIQSHKDKEETLTLERMVQQVEHNLKVSTERALKAEALVCKLKQEVKNKEAEISTLRKENEDLRGQVPLSDINKSAQDLAQQLLEAADMAESPTRILTEGISHLRFLASLVANIAKVTEKDSSSD